MSLVRSGAFIFAAALSGILGCREKPQSKPTAPLVSSGTAVEVITLSDLPEAEEDGLPIGSGKERKNRPPEQSPLRGSPALAARLIVPEKTASKDMERVVPNELPSGPLKSERRPAQGRIAESGDNPMRAELGYGYLSPSPLKGPAVGKENISGKSGLGYGQALQAAAGAVPLAGAVEPPVIEDFDAKARDEMLQTPESGSYRVQVSHSPEFKSVLFEKIYIFEEEMLIVPDLRASGLPTGIYWIRVAFIDLLDFQQPFSSPKRFRLRNPK